MIKWYWEHPVDDVIMYYDRHYRVWVIYPVDAEGNQLCDCEYCIGKENAKKIAADFKRESL